MGGAEAGRRLRERERGWPAALAQLADALEAGIAFPAAVALVAESGPASLRGDLAGFHARLRAGGLASAIVGSRSRVSGRPTRSRLLLRASLLELPADSLAVRQLAGVLAERLEASEKARSRAPRRCSLKAAILALSPIVLFLLVGVASPAYLEAYARRGRSSA